MSLQRGQPNRRNWFHKCRRSKFWLLRDVSTQKELSEGHGTYENKSTTTDYEKDTPDADEDNTLI